MCVCTDINRIVVDCRRFQLKTAVQHFDVCKSYAIYKVSVSSAMGFRSLSTHTHTKCCIHVVPSLSSVKTQYIYNNPQQSIGHTTNRSCFGRKSRCKFLKGKFIKKAIHDFIIEINGRLGKCVNALKF